MSQLRQFFLSFFPVFPFLSFSVFTLHVFFLAKCQFFNMMNCEVKAKCDMIKGLLAEGLYGHIGVNSEQWRGLDDYCDKYFPVLTSHMSDQQLQVTIEKVFTDHHLKTFPVAYNRPGPS